MKKITFLLISSLLYLTSCSSDDVTRELSIPRVSIENLSESTSTAQGDTIFLKANIKSTRESSVIWSLDGEKFKGTDDLIFKFVSDQIGSHEIELFSSNSDGQASSSITIDVYGKYKYGTFVLNEGNMTTGSGSLLFISPQGVATDSAYYKANGSFLGNVSQDLFISEGRIFIISQNGSNDGTLVVANAETLKKEMSFNGELSSLSWPSHVAVLKDYVFIRDNNGVHRFNIRTKELELIPNTRGALKNRMAVVNNKVFVPGNKSVLVIQGDNLEVSHVIDMPGAVSGVIKTSDGNLYVSTTGSPNKITKISATDYSVIQENEITQGKVGAGWGATPGISAKGDTIYFSNASTTIYRHVFSLQQTELVANVKDYVEDANIVYNNLAVHPITGQVYFNTIKGYGWDYLINSLSVFNFSKNPILVENYKDLTDFPAGIFFTYDF
ncbi:DUF5074 domain-containing protein [Myroides sp. LJL119]